MNKQLSKPEVQTILHAVAGMKPGPAQLDVTRRQPRTERAAVVRAWLRGQGVKGVSVTAPNYSMAQSIDIRLPSFADRDHTCYGRRQEFQYGYEQIAACPECRLRQAAQTRLRTLMGQTFPTLGDRSDSQSDYFDYCWTVD